MATAVVEPKVSFDAFIVGLAASLVTGLTLLAIQQKAYEQAEEAAITSGYWDPDVEDRALDPY